MRNQIKIPKKISKKVDSLEEIKTSAPDLQALLESGQFGNQGKLSKTHVALHHSQVSEDPFNFFVVKRAILGAKNNETCAFLNPAILERDESSKKMMLEGCLSFPFRQDKKVLRYTRIHVRYDMINKDLKLEEKTEWVEGLVAQVFQHEIEHGKGNHIYK